MNYRIKVLFIIFTLIIILNGCQIKEKNIIAETSKKRSESKLISQSLNDPRLNKLWTKIQEFNVDLDMDRKEDNIALYTTAERDEQGNIMWDDGQKWLLFVQNEDNFYSLFSEFVQLGSVYFTVSKYSREAIPKVTVIVSSHGNLRLKSYHYDKEKNGFLEEPIYNSKEIIYMFSSIPNYR